MFLSSALPSMLLLPVAFWHPIEKHECDLNIEGGEGANVIMCYNICHRDCRSTFLITLLNWSTVLSSLNFLSIFDQSTGPNYLTKMERPLSSVNMHQKSSIFWREGFPRS